MDIRSKTFKRVLKNTSFLAIGTLITKAMMMIIFIYIARVIGPVKYGTYFVAIEFITLFSVVSKFGMDMTVIREGAKQIDKLDSFQERIFPMRLYLSLIAFLLSIASIAILKYDSITTKMIFILSPVLVLGGAVNGGISEHFNSLFKLSENMKYVAVGKIFRVLIFVILVLYFLLSKTLNIYYIALSAVISSILYLGLQTKLVKNIVKFKVNLNLDYEYLKPLIPTILLFGTSSIMYIITMKIDIQMLNAMSTKLEVGLYSASWQLVTGGLTFITSFSMSLYPNSARKIFQAAYRKKLALFILVLTLISVVIAIIVSGYSSLIISLFFGERYVGSDRILSFLIWYLPLRLSVIWGSHVLECGNWLYSRLVLFSIPMFLNIGLNYFFIPKYNALGAVWATLISNFMFFILLTTLAKYKLKKSMLLTTLK